MRNFGWVSRMVSLLDEYEERLILGDQDLVNILFSVHPDRLFRMTCRWNYRQATCTFHASCSGQTPALLHANRGRFMAPDWAPAFSAIHSVMRKYELGTSLERNFIDPLEHELHRVQRNDFTGDAGETDSLGGVVALETLNVMTMDVLPDEDAILYVDADALFLNPVEELWDVFGKMNESQLIAQAHASEDDSNSWYKLEAKREPEGPCTSRMPSCLPRLDCPWNAPGSSTSAMQENH
ncbi:hypothetical protein HPB47_026081 [Ixodes persulcatus]|uniref:Uncharacterized protein n=1 Tax=Ixodes persulcatus TaxID=34615 RepID=A0AC60Q1Q4_IXOPE|nr:hypothetical protein HPB47_026081 [Ixodes persulcatus]